MPGPTKVVSYSVHASKNSAARWAFWARRAGFRYVHRWLEALAEQEVREREEELGVYKMLDSHP